MGHEGIYTESHPNHLEFVPDALLRITADGIIDEVNRAACELFRKDRKALVGSSVDLLGPGFCVGTWQEHWDHVVAGYWTTGGWSLTRDDGSELYLETSMNRLKLFGNEYMMAFVRDVTDEISAKTALREKEGRYQLATAAGRVAVWDWDIENHVVHSDPFLQSLYGLAKGTGFTPEQWMERIHPDDRAENAERMQQVLAGEEKVFETESRVSDGEGGYRWFHSRGEVVRDPEGRPARVVGTTIDVTSRRQAADALQKAHDELESRIRQRTNELRRAHIKLISTQEDERKRLAAELHDSFAQELIVIQMAVKRAAAAEDVPQEYIDMLNSAADHCSSLITQVRRISHGLYPPMLESMGLCLSLQAFLKISDAVRINVSFDYDEKLATKRFSPETEIALFRIAQESVTNAIRHGEPRSIDIRFNVKEDRLRLEITDDGKGFEVNDAEGHGLGLQSMTDRATAVGGELVVESAPGRISIVAEVPYKPVL